MKHLNFEKQEQKLDQEIQKKLDDCFDNYSQDKQYDLFELLIKKRSIYKIINKNAFRSPRFIEFDDLKQETYSILGKFIKTGIKDQRKRQISFFVTRLESSINNLIRKLYGIKRHGDKTDKEETNKKYSRVLNYTNEDQLENPIVQFDKILDPNQELMKEIKQEELITKINFAKLSENEKKIIKLAFQIDENNKFSQTMNSLNNQEIADYINEKNNKIYSDMNVKDFKKNALTKIRNLYQPKEVTISPDPTIIHYFEEWHKLNGKIGKRQNLIKQQKLICINKIDEKGQLLGSKQFYTDDKLQRHDEYSNGELIRTTIYLSDNKTINYVNTFNPKKDKTIDNFKRNELLKNQTFINKLERLVKLQKIIPKNKKEEKILKQAIQRMKKSFKLEKHELKELINSIATIGIKTNY